MEYFEVWIALVATAAGITTKSHIASSSVTAVLNLEIKIGLLFYV